MSVTVGPKKEQEPLTADDIRELEILLNLSRTKREALGAWLRRLKVPMNPRIREQLVSMDRYLDDWYDVALVDCVEQYEVKTAAKDQEQGGGDQRQQEQRDQEKEQRQQEQPEQEPTAAGSGHAPSSTKGRGRGRGGRARQERQVAIGRAGRAQGQVFVAPPPPVVTPGGRVRSRRAAAEEADRTLEESFDRGEIVEEQEKSSRKRRQHQHQNAIRKAAKTRQPAKGKRKKKKILKTRTVKKELVSVKDVAAFLEMVRVERDIPAEEAMVRLAIDGGQGSLKVVANIFSR